MKVGQLRCATFSETTPVLLRDAINNFALGKAAGTAPNDYAAGFVKEQQLYAVQYFLASAGNVFNAIVFYTE